MVGGELHGKKRRNTRRGMAPYRSRPNTLGYKLGATVLGLFAVGALIVFAFAGSDKTPPSATPTATAEPVPTATTEAVPDPASARTAVLQYLAAAQTGDRQALVAISVPGAVPTDTTQALPGCVAGLRGHVPTAPSDLQGNITGRDGSYFFTYGPDLAGKRWAVTLEVVYTLEQWKVGACSATPLEDGRAPVREWPGWTRMARTASPQAYG